MSDTNETYEMTDAEAAEWEASIDCECEIDWNCPMHAHRVGTFIETRHF